MMGRNSGARMRWRAHILAIGLCLLCACGGGAIYCELESAMTIEGNRFEEAVPTGRERAFFGNEYRAIGSGGRGIGY